MILRQFLHTEPVIAASYLVGCGGKGVAAVVDPVADPELATSAEDGARALFESACRLRALPITCSCCRARFPARCVAGA